MPAEPIPDPHQPRRFRRPWTWSVNEFGAAVVVRDADGAGLAWLYFRDDKTASSVGSMTFAEARRVASFIVRAANEHGG